MAVGSQQANVELLAALTGLTHDIFVGDVQNNVIRESKVASIMQDAGPGDFKFAGQNTVFAVELDFKTGGIASLGMIPDYVPLDAVQGKVQPKRRYAQIALDNFIELLASGQGSFEDLGDRIFNTLWDAWKSMTIRHAIGASTGLVAKVSSRTSSTVVVLKDGYGNAGTNPIQHISKNAVLCWYDVSAAAIGGAAKVSSIAASTNTVTLDSATTWETTVGNAIAADDLIYFATTNLTTRDRFEAERNNAPNGLGTILDPAAAATTVFNIAEGDYPRWKPYRKASSTFDHMEVTEHWLQLGAHRGFDVSPQTDVFISHPGPLAQLARSLMAYQQQAYTGAQLKGGYTGVTIGNMVGVSDSFFYHDVAATLCKEKLYRVVLGGEADFWSGDGSMWSRIEDFDGRTAFVPEYMNYFSNHRGAHGALTGIVTPDIVDTDYTSVPNY